MERAVYLCWRINSRSNIVPIPEHDTHSMQDNPKVKIEGTEFGKGLVAVAPINKDEVIAVFDGDIYKAEKATDLPKDIADHAIQISKHEWKDSRGFARFINHSCEPNVGYRGVDTLVAMRNIEAGENLTLDYEMSEDSDWRMECLCGAANCRGVIGSFKNMPQDVRERYSGYISDWLKK